MDCPSIALGIACGFCPWLKAAFQSQSVRRSLGNNVRDSPCRCESRSPTVAAATNAHSVEKEPLSQPCTSESEAFKAAPLGHHVPICSICPNFPSICAFMILAFFHWKVHSGFHDSKSNNGSAIEYSWPWATPITFLVTHPLHSSSPSFSSFSSKISCWISPRSAAK